MKIQAKLGAGLVVLASTLVVSIGTPAKAAPCADSTLSVLQAAGSCTDALGFTFVLNSFAGFSANDAFSFQSANTTFQYSLQGAAAWTVAGSPYQLNYSVTAPTGKLLNFYTSNLSSANNPLADAGTYAITGANGIANATFTPPLSASGGFKTYDPKITTDTFSSSLNVTGGTIASVTGSVGFINPPPAIPTPGPLPLLGAGAAFGLSRKLRNRIRFAA